MSLAASGASYANIPGLDVQNHQTTLSGTVTNEAGAPIAGATVTNTANQSATQTHGDGSFTITGKVGDQLRISYLGYEEVTLDVASTTRNRVILKPAENLMEEVLVSIGYQQVRKSDVTGAIANVKAGELNLASPKTSPPKIPARN